MMHIWCVLLKKLEIDTWRITNDWKIFFEKLIHFMIDIYFRICLPRKKFYSVIWKYDFNSLYDFSYQNFKSWLRLRTWVGGSEFLYVPIIWPVLSYEPVTNIIWRLLLIFRFIVDRYQYKCITLNFFIWHKKFWGTDFSEFDFLQK